ncbi:MAG: hypothetical protein ACKN9U_01000, partial [Pirellulaceae bacterium]
AQGRGKRSRTKHGATGEGHGIRFLKGRFQGTNRDGLLGPPRMGLWVDPSLQDNGLKKFQARRPAAAPEISSPRERIAMITIAVGFPQKKRKGIHREP